MRLLYFALLTLTFHATPTIAQEITSQPICFTIRNEAPYRVYGDVTTNYYTTPDGTKARHTGTFRLQKAGTRHKTEGHPLDISEFCSSGPFYPGRQLEITLRTFVPVFSCKTSIEAGEIVIKGQRKKEGGVRTWAVCY
ncbi:MAG: hypothetical protein COB14_00140 [Alphaproteobacteria bacterium]|nr:MAG: hypothetical protein COB14_00140 [Alphaproteobacteria bacterium]